MLFLKAMAAAGAAVAVGTAAGTANAAGADDGTAVAAGSAYETAVADVVMGETEDAGWEGQYAWEWVPKTPAPQQRSQNNNGVTGWGRLLISSNPHRKPGVWCKVHVCAHNPCKARWDKSKCGMSPGTHMQTITNMGPPAPLQAPLPEVQPAPPALCDTAVAGVPVAGGTCKPHRSRGSHGRVGRRSRGLLKCMHRDVAVGARAPTTEALCRLLRFFGVRFVQAVPAVCVGRRAPHKLVGPLCTLGLRVVYPSLCCGCCPLRPRRHGWRQD